MFWPSLRRKVAFRNYDMCEAPLYIQSNMSCQTGMPYKFAQKSCQIH